MKYPDIQKALQDLVDEIETHCNSMDLCVLDLTLKGQVSNDPLIKAMISRLNSGARVGPVDMPELVLRTNRVAMWRFFERYVCVADATTGLKQVNPFKGAAKEWSSVQEGWKPFMKKEIRKLTNSSISSSYNDDLYMIAVVALLETLERQAMDIIAMSRKAQMIPFHIKLKFAMQRHMLQEGRRLLEGDQSGADAGSIRSFDEIGYEGNEISTLNDY